MDHSMAYGAIDTHKKTIAVSVADRKSMRYRSQRDGDAEVRSKLRELAQQRRRFGYRRLHILLRREGIVINRKKPHTARHWKEWLELKSAHI